MENTDKSSLPLKIGFFTETYLPDLNGVSVSVAFAKSELEKNGHQVYIFAPKRRGYKDQEANIIRLRGLTVLKSEPVLKLPMPSRDFRKILQLKLDVVHSHGGALVSMVGYELALAKGYPYILSYNTNVEKVSHYFFLKNKKITLPIIKKGCRFICDLSDIVVVPSKKMKTILQDYGVKKEIAIIPSSINLTDFTKGEKGFLRKKLNLDVKQNILVTVARLSKEKNIDFIIKSFLKISQKNNKTVLVIVGAGPEQAKLKTLTLELGLEKKIFFTGYIDTKLMPAVYSDADIFVFASTAETQGLVVLEAAACGLPLVAIKDEAFEGAIKNNFNGYLVAENTNLFAEKTLDLINNQAKRKQFSINSGKYVRDTFDQNKIVKKLENVYRDVIEIRKNKPRVTRRLQSRVKKFTKIFS